MESLPEAQREGLESRFWRISLAAEGQSNALEFTAEETTPITTLAIRMTGAAKLFHATVYTNYRGVGLEANPETVWTDIVRRFEEQQKLHEQARQGLELPL